METAGVIWLAILCVLAIGGWRASVKQHPQENTFLGLLLVVAIVGAIGFPFISFLMG